MTAPAPPEPKIRAKFAQWLFDRRLGPRDVADELGVTSTYVWMICLPCDDRSWRSPSKVVRERIAAFTQGVVGVEDWPAPFRLRFAGVAQ